MKELFTLETGYRTTNGGPVAATRDGRILWLTTVPCFPGEKLFHLVRLELRESTDCGRSWGLPRTLLRGTREVAPNTSALLRLRSGRLIHFVSFYGGYSSDHDPDKSLNEGYTQASDDDGRTWSEPARIPSAERYLSSVFSSIQTATGRVIFPFGYLTGRKGKFVCSVVYSDDEGRTWRRSPSVLDAGGEGFESGACEPSVVELPDGRLWMLIRAQTGFHWESFSSDDGATWEPARPSRFPGSNAPAVQLRLSNRRVLVAWNNSVRWAYARHSLVVAATDDGKRFFGFREIAHVDYPVPNATVYWSVTYPYLCEAPDGTMLISFNHGDWNFNQARLARIDSAWLEQADMVEEFTDGFGDWCRLGAGGDSLTAYDGGSGAALQIEAQQGKPGGAVRNFPLLAEGQIEFTAVVLKPPAHLLLHDSFPPPGEIDEARLRVRFAPEGAVFVAAGTPRTKDLGREAGQQYSYLACSVDKEIAYPARIRFGKPFTLRVRCSVERKESSVSVDGGPEVKLQLGEMFGLSFLGAAASDNGVLQLRRVATRCSR